MTCVFVLSTLLLPGALGLAPGAQAPPPAPPRRRQPQRRRPRSRRPSGGDSGRLDRDRVLMLTAGRSMVLTTAYDITRIAITDPKIADAVVVQPREVLIDGRSAGTVSLIVWGAGRREQYDVVVDPGVTTLQQTLPDAVPGRGHPGRGQRRRHHPRRAGLDQRGDAAGRARLPPATKANARVVNMLQLPGGNASQQVMLQVRFAEVNRAALMQAGFTLLHQRAALQRPRPRRSSSPAPDFDDAEGGDGLGVHRLPQPLLLRSQGRHRRRAQGARVEGLLPEPGRAEPDRLQRPGGQLPGRRRVPDPDRPGRCSNNTVTIVSSRSSACA